MAVKYVDDFEFPSSGQTHVRGYFRGGKVEKAMGGIVQPPKSGVRPVRPADAQRAQKYAETMAMRPNRGTRVGAKIATPKAPKTTVAKPKVSQPPMGALQSAPAMPTMAKGGKVDTEGYGANATGDENNNGRSFRPGARNDEAVPKSRSQTDPDAGMFEKGVAAAAMRKPRKGVEKYDMGEGTRLSVGEMDDRAAMQAQNMRRHTDEANGAAFARGGRLTAKNRGALPASKFAGPDRSYPVPDRSHAANAKARASQAVNAGRMTPAERAKIDAKANAVLKR